MSEKAPLTAGGCMCGAIRFKSEGAPLAVAHCHCEDCRSHTGAPVVTYVVFKSTEVHFLEGERKIYESSPGIGRAFCGDCGTPLSWEGFSNVFEADIVEFYISLFDEPETFIPDRHWFHRERIGWFDVADNLPRHRRLGLEEAPYRRGPVDSGLPG